MARNTATGAYQAELKRQEAMLLVNVNSTNEEDAIDAFIADKQRQREINNFPLAFIRKIAMIDAKYDKEVEKIQESRR